ncbi:MAG: UDP-N-acetylglucosamine 2-epimerase (non-hydrolyzing) [Candidatus Bathyarchaeia archaeon]
MNVISVVGTRPEIIKMSLLIPLLDNMFEHKILYTGQHYDYYLSEIFFKEFNLRKPDYKLDLCIKDLNLECFKQTFSMINDVKEVMRKEKPELCIVLGDTNSTLAGAVAASKLNVPLAHVEAGLRSFDLTMPEERNRIVVDHLSSLLLAPSALALNNLKCEGIEGGYVVGNTIVDVCMKFKHKASKLKQFEKYNLTPKDYLVVTLHREYNTREEVLIKIFNALNKLNEIQMIIPIHPRTKQKLIELGFWDIVTKQTHIKIINPLGYLEFLSLMLDSKMVLTDSGGVQEEAVTLKIPCLTLRDNTERWETVYIGANRLTSTNPKKILDEVKKAWNDEEWIKKMDSIINPYGDGYASEKIASKINEYCELKN